MISKSWLTLLTSLTVLPAFNIISPFFMHRQYTLSKSPNIINIMLNLIIFLTWKKNRWNQNFIFINLLVQEIEPWASCMISKCSIGAMPPCHGAMLQNSRHLCVWGGTTLAQRTLLEVSWYPSYISQSTENCSVLTFSSGSSTVAFTFTYTPNIIITHLSEKKVTQPGARKLSVKAFSES